MNIAQMIQEGGPAVAAAVAALVDPAIQPDALHLAAVGLARQQADEIERLTAERDKAHQDGIRAACERDAMRSERDSLLEQLAAAQREVVDRLAEAAALQEDLRYVAHSGMGSGLEQKPAAWACIWPDECGGGGFTTLDETAARNYMAGAREYQPGPKLVPLYAAPVHVAPAGWQTRDENGFPVEPER